MPNSYNGITAKLEDSIFEFTDSDMDQIDFILNFISNPDHYINFGTGLSLFLKQHGYKGDLYNTSTKVAFLNNALSEQNLSLENKTLNNWFTNKVRPMYKESQRESIYKICFALKLDEQATALFFNHIYFDRAFNFRNTREFVYYFCLKNQLSYEVAEDILTKLTYVAEDTTSKDATILTSFMHNNIESLTTAEDIVNYIVTHPNNFSKYNVSATKVLNTLTKQLIGSPNDKELIHQYRKSPQSVKTPTFDSIAIQEAFLGEQYLKNNMNETYKDDSLFKNKDVTSIDFLLSVIYQSDLKKASLKKIREQFERNHPLFIRQIADMLLLNFPDKKVLSNVLNFNKDRMPSYDALRKAIILLHFYSFWAPQYIAEEYDYEEESFELDLEYDDYIDEINSKLNYAGMGGMYVVNPYDRLFMICSTTKNPLMLFRSIVSTIFDET